MLETKVLSYTKMLDIYNFLNRENIPESKAVAIREIDITSLEILRNKIKSSGKKATYTSFVAKAVAQVLKEMPHANRVTVRGLFLRRVVEFQKAHVSVAVERNDSDMQSGGAFAYTIYNTDEKGLVDISDEISGLSEIPASSGDPRIERWVRMLEGARRAPFVWMIQLVIWLHKNIPSLYVKNRGGAAMISSPSKYGVDFIVAHWPYTLGISFGLAKLRPWVVNNELTVRKTMTMTLAFDRRLISGANAARFMNRMCEILENADSFFQNEISKTP